MNREITKCPPMPAHGYADKDTYQSFSQKEQAAWDSGKLMDDNAEEFRQNFGYRNTYGHKSKK